MSETENDIHLTDSKAPNSDEQQQKPPHTRSFAQLYLSDSDWAALASSILSVPQIRVQGGSLTGPAALSLLLLQLLTGRGAPELFVCHRQAPLVEGGAASLAAAGTDPGVQQGLRGAMPHCRIHLEIEEGRSEQGGRKE